MNRVKEKIGCSMSRKTGLYVFVLFHKMTELKHKWKSRGLRYRRGWKVISDELLGRLNQGYEDLATKQDNKKLLPFFCMTHCILPQLKNSQNQRKSFKSQNKTLSLTKIIPTFIASH